MNAATDDENASITPEAARKTEVKKLVVVAEVPVAFVKPISASVTAPVTVKFEIVVVARFVVPVAVKFWVITSVAKTEPKVAVPETVRVSSEPSVPEKVEFVIVAWSILTLAKLSIL